MSTMASQITCLTIVFSVVYSGEDQRKIQSSAHWFCAGNSPGPVNSPHKGPVTLKMFPFDDIIMITWVTRITMWHVRKRGSFRWPMWWCHLPSLGSPVIEIRRFDGPPIFTMEFPVQVRWCLFYIKSETRVVTVLSAIKKYCHKFVSYISHSRFVFLSIFRGPPKPLYSTRPSSRETADSYLDMNLVQRLGPNTTVQRSALTKCKRSMTSFSLFIKMDATCIISYAFVIMSSCCIPSICV